MKNKIKHIIDLFIKEELDEINAISTGGGSVQSNNQIDGTGGNPLGREMQSQYDILWSGDEPEEEQNKENSLKEEKLDEEEIDDFNAMGTGAVVGYTLPIGMKPSPGKMGTKKKKKKRPKRWYDVHKEGKYTLKKAFFEQIETYGQYDWAHAPLDEIDEKMRDAFLNMYSNWFSDQEILHYDPKGIDKQAVENSTKRGLWLPGHGKKSLLVIYPKEDKIVITTNLFDPRVAIAISTSIKWIPNLLNYKVETANNDKPLGIVKDLLSNVKKKKFTSKQWNKRADDEEETTYQEFEYEVLKDLTEQDWYHATKVSNLNSIMEKGLLPSNDVPQGTGWTQLNLDLQNAVYLTADKEYATAIAETLLSRFDEPAVVLRVSGEAFEDPTKLAVDEDVLRSELDNSVVGGKLKPGLPHFMSSVVEQIQSVGYEDVIPANQISVELVLDVEYERNDEGNITNAEVYEYTWDEWKSKRDLDEEFIGKKGGISYFQMGGSLPDHLYNRTNKGKPTRNPGVAGIKKRKK